MHAVYIKKKKYLTGPYELIENESNRSATIPV